MKIIIPFKTPTINHLYGQRRSGVRFIKKEALDLKKEIKLIVQEISNDLELTDKLQIHVKVYENWYCKNGSIKCKDISNREKFLTDSIFAALDIDDKQIFKHTMEKIQSEKEYSEVIIEKL